MPKKYQNKGEVVVEAPTDYYMRWDASDHSSFGWLTDEATNDVNRWTDNIRGIDANYVAYGFGSYPARLRDADGYWHYRCYGEGHKVVAVGNLQAADYDAWEAIDDATNVTCFVVGMMNDMTNASAGQNHYIMGNSPNATRVGWQSQLDTVGLYADGAWRYSTNAFNQRKFVTAFRNVHNGVDDNDTSVWFGQTLLHKGTGQTDTSVSGSNGLGFGTYLTGSSDVWKSDSNFYELLIFDRSLSDGEISAVSSYLSAKWGANKEDSATDIITEPLNTFPQDYWERWDATTSSGMGFFTDEATGDCEGWLGEKGNVWLVDTGGGTYPAWTPGKMTFAGSGNKGLQTTNLTSKFSGNARAVFVAGKINVASPANGSIFAGPTAYIRFEDISDATQFAFNDGVNNQNPSTNNLIDTSIACGYSTDTTDINWWWGANSKNTDTVSGGTFNEALVSLFVGMANASDLTTMDGELHELIVYDRHVSDAEAERILNYLSAKWQVQNEDSASTVIAAYDGLGHTWKSDGPDPQGLQLEGFTPVNHTVTPLRNADAPRVPGLPLDYVVRFDATDSSGIGYLTDPGTNDVDSWVDQTGTVTLLDSGVVTNYPEYITDADGLPCVHFQRDGTLVSTFFGSSSVDSTSFCVVKYNDLASESGNAYAVRSWGDMRVMNTNAGGSKLSLFPVTVDDTTNDFDNTRCVMGFSNSHVGTDDNDWFKYLGLTQFASGTTATDVATDDRRLEMGGYGGGGESDCNVYELIVYDRVLSDLERENVAKYLSAKWQAQNEDSASSVIATVSTGSDQNFDDNRYPANTWGSLVKYHFDAAQTGGMTFATGDATSGGTISSWTDVTASTTANTATSGDSALDYVVNAYKGHPAVKGDGSTSSLESGAVTYSTTDTHQRLFWAVTGGPYDSGSGSPASWYGLNSYISTLAAYNNDLGSGKNPLCIAAGGASTVYMPMSVRDPGEIHVLLMRVTVDAGGSPLCERWVEGLKAPNQNGNTNLDGASNPVAFGALTNSTFHSDAYVFEMGAVDGAGTAISDADVEGLIQYLCNKYNVDYMPATTPMDIGLHARTVSSVTAQTDCCLWFEPSTMSPAGWELHPVCAALHTTPTNFRMSPPTGAVPMEKRTSVLGKPSLRSTEGMTQHLESDTVYVSTETTDFPADTLGMSTFGVMRLDPATVAASGARTGNGICHVRFSGTSDTTLQVLASNVSQNWPHANDWIIIGNSYAYDDDGTGTEGYPGSTDGGPGAYYYCNDETVKTAATPAATSYSVENWLNWDIADGVAHMSEIVVFKHPLTIEEINELKKYFQYKYNYLFDT